MKRGFFILVLALACSSCASILTGKRSQVKIHTDKSVPIVVDRDTINWVGGGPITWRVENKKMPLPIIVLDSTQRQPFLAIKAHKPFTYWLNAVPFFYFGGFLVDEVTGLKWRYPRNIYITSDSTGLSYLPYVPMEPEMLERKNKVTFAPLSVINAYHPAWELGYERLQGDRGAIQFTFGIFRSWENNYARNSRGFKTSVEKKFYLRNQRTTRFYLSGVLEYIHKNHDANLQFEVVDAQGNLVQPVQVFNQLMTIEKRFVSLKPRFGVETYITPRFVVEGFFGLGIRSRVVRHQNNNPFIRFREDLDLFFVDTEYLSNRPTINFGLDFDLNFRLAWVF